jgi:plastocyanin
MRRLYLLLILYSLATVVVAACTSISAATNTNVGATGSQVHMNDSSFVQSSITIKKGESITLVADTLVGHTISNGTWDNGTPKSIREPGAPLIDNVPVGGNSSATVGPFASAGTFELYCTIHPGMNLAVIVQ